MENIDLIEEKIQVQLSTLDLKVYNMKFVGISSIISVIIGVAFIISSRVLVHHFISRTEEWIIWLLFAIGVIFWVISGILIWIFSLNSKKISKYNQKILKESVPSLHKIFFENSDLEYLLNKKNLKFEGIYPSEVFDNTNCFHFSLGTEKIIWNITEDREFRARQFVIGNSRSRWVYLLKHQLSSTSKKLEGLSNIYINGGKTPRRDENYFQSESMEFNSYFKVNSDDKMQVYKIFTPKIIDNFVQAGPNFLGSKTIELINGQALIAKKESKVSQYSWIPDPLDFSKIRWNKKSVMKKDIMKKIKLDFDRYLKVLKLLEPLELFENN